MSLGSRVSRACGLSDRHLLAVCLGVGASLVMPHPMVALSALLLLPFTVRYALISASAFLIGLAWAGLDAVAWQTAQIPEACLRQQVQLTGHVVTLPKHTQLEGDRWLITADVKVTGMSRRDCGRPGVIRVSQYLGEAQLGEALRYNTEIGGLFRFKALSSQWNPGSQPDQARWASRGLDAAATAIGSLSIKPVDNPIADFRSRALQRWSERPDEGWAVMRALLLSDTRSMTENAWRDLRHLGIVHVLVISGLHIGLVASIAWFCLCLPRRLMRLPGDEGGMGLITLTLLAVVGVYVLLVGAGLPVIRAYFMLIAASIPQMLGWQSSGRRGLLVAITIMLLWDARVLLGASFWLSATATFLLVSTTARSFGLRRLFALQAKMVFCMAPITLFWFSETSLLGLLTNLIVLPVASVIMVPAGLVGLILIDVAPPVADAMWAAGATSWELLNWPLQRLLGCCRDWGVVSASLSWQGLVLGTLALGLFQRYRRWSLISGAMTAWILIVDADAPSVDAITVLDVGQGLSVVVHVAGRTLVYDTGQGRPGGFSQAEKVLTPYLSQHSLNKIDVLLVSHGDQDHSGGLDYLNERIAIDRRLGFGGEPCRNGERWRWEAVEFLVINGPGQGDEARNDHSCGLLVSTSGWAMLIPGDVSEEKEREWVRYWRHELRAEVLLLGHHGSRTSTGHALLKWAKPAAALVSAGRGNPFGHPHLAVLRRLNKAGIDRILDTGRHGAISISFRDKLGLTLQGRRNPWSPYWLKLP